MLLAQAEPSTSVRARRKSDFKGRPVPAAVPGLRGLRRAPVGGYLPRLETAGGQRWAGEPGCQPIPLRSRSRFSSRVTELSGGCFAQWYLITFLLLPNIKQ